MNSKANVEVANGSNQNQRVVADPRDRKRRTWTLSFKPGRIGHIIDKHVKDISQPWNEILEKSLFEELVKRVSNERTSRTTDRLKAALLNFAEQSCKRPQVLAFTERFDISQADGPGSPQCFDGTECALLICRCGLLIALRTIDSKPQIHTAFFKSRVGRQRGADDRWLSLTRQMRADYVCIDHDRRLVYPQPEAFRMVQDEDNPSVCIQRSSIQFLSKYTWGFIEVQGASRPLGTIPDWSDA